jgi:hypothetical protein
MAWIYTAYVDWTKDQPLNSGYMYAQKIQVQLISGDRTKKVILNVDGSNSVTEFLLPVKKDLFVYTIIAKTSNNDTILRSALLGFSTAKIISTPAGLENRVSAVGVIFTSDYTQIGWLLDAFSRSPYPALFRPLCDTASYSENYFPYYDIGYGFMLGSGAYTKVLESADKSVWDFDKTAFQNGMKTSPIKLSGKINSAWKSAFCLEPETYTTYTQLSNQSEATKIYFPSVYSLFQLSSSSSFATQYAKSQKWKRGEDAYMGYPVTDTTKLINSE